MTTERYVGVFKVGLLVRGTVDIKTWGSRLKVKMWIACKQKEKQNLLGSGFDLIWGMWKITE